MRGLNSMGLKYPNGSGDIIFCRKRDYYLFYDGIAIFTFGGTLTILTPLNCVPGLICAFLTGCVGAIMALTSRICMKV